ncbi:DUF3348 domain-containing protein [Noviherbaspirillum galbum]|uniref:DUF3348 domain-containing protein n=1 Tax=Noviherbaspirillum galbum TaxID=2709383 RepID=A0A6B3STQ2_9BURK|nr:DUF3348 domain-containing protein [Noviherbaspirillum galbum]NEX64173.1 DUF3348 domain-containing protein [Noviherbaspirillum galbum]
MTRALPRTNFHSSDLIRCLARLDVVEGIEPEKAFAERLGQWIHFADAITLSAVHGDMAPSSASPSPALQAMSKAGHAAGAAQAITGDVEKIQSILAGSITRSYSAKPGKSGIRLPEPNLELPLDVAAAFAPYRRFHESHQRDMSLSIPPLRANVRQALAGMSPQHRQFAELDKTLEKILAERETRLLARVPALLGKRFAQLFRNHQQRLDAIPQADDPAAWMRPGGWLARFREELRTVLLAELDLRMQPTLGLLHMLQAPSAPAEA